MKAKKSLGQHFLHNEYVAEKIANAIDEADLDNILEVGPGMGMLTKYLVKKGKNLKVVELDRESVTWLNENMPELKDDIINGDFLKLRLEAIFDGQFALIGNYPYNISSQIVFKMIDYRDRIPVMVGMFQREMARRIVAPPGNKEYGVISVLSQAYYEGKLLFYVSKGQFNPPPKVESAVIRLVRKEIDDFGCDEKLFKRIVKLSFNQRRKMLRSSLKSMMKGIDHTSDEIFTERPEQLSVKDFIYLTNIFEKA